MTDGLVLAIDGGGSKTLIALADRTGGIARAERGKGVNPMDNRNWRGELDAQLRPFVSQPGLVAIAAALPAFGEVDHISAEQRETIATAFGAVPQRVLNDVDAAQIGAFAGGPGILILSGTGSMAWARDAAGRSHRVGGWGDAIGDEGSSFWIGRRILGLVTQSLDGRAGPTALAAAVFDQLGIDEADPTNGLGGWVSRLTHPRSEIGALAPLATRLAEAGDSAAKAIVEAAADELARHYTAIQRLAGASSEWSYAGGTLASRALRDAVTTLIGRPPRPPRLPPIGGALLAAAKLGDWPTDTNWIERLAASLRNTSDAYEEPQLTN
jgi:glucosamine kinase